LVNSSTSASCGEATYKKMPLPARLQQLLEKTVTTGNTRATADTAALLVLLLPPLMLLL